MKVNEKTGLVPCEMLISGVRGLRKGEIAGFPAAVAKNLIDKKAAKAVDPKAPPKEPAKAA